MQFGFVMYVHEINFFVILTYKDNQPSSLFYHSLLFCKYDTELHRATEPFLYQYDILPQSL